jgi:hypothetical protein
MAVWLPTAKPVIACIAEPNVTTELLFTNSNESPAHIEFPDPLPADNGALGAICPQSRNHASGAWDEPSEVVARSRSYRH